MKSGVSLQQMLTEVKRQSESKEDYLIAPNRLRMESYGKEMFLHLSDDSGTELIEPMTITGIAHRQIGTHLRIPAAYYDRMREERPDLLAYNANTWFKQENSQRMLRTLDGSARAYLSNRYRRIDNIDIAGVTLPILGGLPDIRFESCQITESRMYIKAVNPRLQAEVSPGDIVQAGVIISNSEVGLGSVSIQPLIYRLVCSNGMCKGQIVNGGSIDSLRGTQFNGNIIAPFPSGITMVSNDSGASHRAGNRFTIKARHANDKTIHAINVHTIMARPTRPGIVKHPIITINAINTFKKHKFTFFRFLPIG